MLLQFFIQFFMKYLHVLMSWPEDMDMLWVKFLSFVSVFCSVNYNSYIQRQTKSGGGHKFSEFACCVCFVVVYFAFSPIF